MTDKSPISPYGRRLIEDMTIPGSAQGPLPVYPPLKKFADLPGPVCLQCHRPDGHRYQLGWPRSYVGEPPTSAPLHCGFFFKITTETPHILPGASISTREPRRLPCF